MELRTSRHECPIPVQTRAQGRLDSAPSTYQIRYHVLVFSIILAPRTAKFELLAMGLLFFTSRVSHFEKIPDPDPFLKQVLVSGVVPSTSIPCYVLD